MHLTNILHLIRHHGKKAVALTLLLASATAANAQGRIPTGSRISVDRISAGTGYPTSASSNALRSGTNAMGTSDSSHVDTSATKGLVFVQETPDSVLREKVFFFHYVPRTVKIDEVWNPTLDPTGVQYYYPTDGMVENYFLGMGTIGHPQFEIYSAMVSGISHSLQQDGNSSLLKTPENLRLYQTLTPYTRLSYNNSLKKDYLVRVGHTQNIIPGWNVAFDYELVCPEGNLSGSGAKNSHLDITTNYFSRDSRLQVQAGFIWQSMKTDENGGLTDDSYFTSNQTSNLGGLPVRLENSSSKNLYHNAFARVTYNLVQQVEKYRQHETLVVRYDTVSADSVRIIMDTLVHVDTIAARKPRTLNAGVVGVEMDYGRWKRAAYLTSLYDSTLWSNASATLFWTNDAYPDHRWHNPLKVTLGTTARRLDAILTTDTTQGPDTLMSAALVNPFAKAEISMGPFTLGLEAELDNSSLAFSSKLEEPNYHLSAQIGMDFDSAGNSGMELLGRIQRVLPELRMMHLSDYNLAPVSGQYLNLRLFRTSDSGFFRHVELNAGATHLDHHLWYDSTLSVVVGDHDLWLYQACATLRMQWSWFHVDMQQLLQYSTDSEQVEIPLWASKNSVYADFTLFHRALRMQIGFDLRFYTAFAPDAYDPATGLFYGQSTETGNYLWGDAFINLQVKRASIYVKGGHINALWESHPNYFLLPHYPGNRFGLFWGITWNFFD